MMSSTKLFQPLQIGRMQLQHRVVMAPLTRFRADTEHVPLPVVTEYYAQRAVVTPGTLLIAEATMPAPHHCGWANAPGIWSEVQIRRWKEVTDAVHAKGCFIYLQIDPPGRAAREPFPCVAPSPIPIDQASRMPRELAEEEIWEVIQAVVTASKNAITAGFDGIELHGANGYLIDQFLQDNCNQRTDRWGGSTANRSRFALELAKAVTDAIGGDRVGIRFSPWSTFQSMRMKDPVSQFSHVVEGLKQYNLAYIHIIESRVHNSFDVEKTDGIEFLLDIWANQSPVLVAGGFKRDIAMNAVDEEYKKYDTAVVFGRFFISTPDLVFRLQHGLEPNPYDRSTFYTPVQSEGYIDYPFSEEYLAQAQVQA